MRPPHRSLRTWMLVIAVALGLAAGAFGLALTRSSGPQSVSAPQGSSVPAVVQRSDSGEGGAEPASGVTADLAAAQVSRLEAMPAMASTSPLPRIAGDASQQPDLYAAEFARRLLAQDYALPRDGLLSWVQAESTQTREPLVVGMVPERLRDKLAIFSVSDGSTAQAPIPSTQEWAALRAQDATTYVVIDRVEEPFAWTNAVSSGRVTDPGATARDVSATVTRTVRAQGREHTSTFSVGMTINLEGPPTRDGWGFVALISYSSVQVS